MYPRLVPSVLAAFLATAIPAQSPRAVEEVFPASSFGFVQFGGLKACSEGARDLGLVRLGAQTLDRLGPDVFESDLMRELLKEAGRELGHINKEQIARALAHLQRELKRSGLDTATLRAALQNPMALGVGRPTFFGGAPVPSVTLAIDTTHCDDELDKLLAVFESHLKQLGPVIERRQESIHGADVTVLSSPGHSGSIAWARSGRFLLLGNSIGYLRDCLASCAGDLPSLAKDPGFRSGRGKLPESMLLSGYLNVAPVCKALSPFLPYEIGDVFAAVGTEEVDGFFFGVSTEDGGSLDVAHAAIRGPENGILRSVLGRSASIDSAALCPDDTLFYMTASVDPGRVLDACVRLVDALPPEVGREIEREFLRELERELRHENMTVEQCEQLVRLFGPEISVAVTTPAGSAVVPEIVLMIDVTDMQHAEHLVAMLVDDMAHAQVRETSYGDTLIRYSNAVRKQAPYSPALAIADNRILLASSVQAMKGILARAEGKRASLADQEDFARHAANAKGASVFAAARLRSAVPHLWKLAERFVEMGLAQAEIDPEILPTPEELEAGVCDSVGTLTVDGHGITLKSRNVFGLGAIVAVLGLAMDEALAAAPETAKASQPGAKTYKIH